MSPFVLDCAIAIAWCIEDEADGATDALLDRLRSTGAWAPSIWPHEIANVLLQAERRGQITQAAVDGRLTLLEQLPIEIDPLPWWRSGQAVLALARQHRLSAYDAAYLELAARSALPLATKDKALARAHAAMGGTVLP